jgi:hypothetical protein
MHSKLWVHIFFIAKFIAKKNHLDLRWSSGLHVCVVKRIELRPIDIPFCDV